MIENVRGMLGAVFEDFRQGLKDRFRKMGYHAEWRIFNASDFGVPQLRPRVVIVALRRDIVHHFSWPTGEGSTPPTVGETLYDLMVERGWRGAGRWRERADDIAPTIVGGSLKHGGRLGANPCKEGMGNAGR